MSSDRPYFISTEEDNIVYHIYDTKNNIDYAFKYEDGSDNLVGIMMDNDIIYDKIVGKLIHIKPNKNRLLYEFNENNHIIYTQRPGVCRKSDLFTSHRYIGKNGTVYLEKVYR